jgi:uncharacterized protein YbjT (DUF2867 family)
MDGKRIALVVGASGLIGNTLVHMLLENPNYHQVRILGRTMPDIQHDKLSFHPAKLLENSFPRSAFAGVHDIFCTIGTTQKKTPDKAEYRNIDCGIPAKMAKVGRIFRAHKFLVVSSIGASTSSRFFYLRVKGEMEEKVIQSGMPTIEIFRPATLLGRRKEFRFGESISRFFDPLTRWFIPKKYRGIKAGKVAEAMIVRALDDVEPGISVWESYQIEQLSQIK